MMRKNKPFFHLTVIILLNLVLVACTFASRSEQYDEDVADAVIQTMEARIQETQQAQQQSDKLIAAVVSQVLTALPPQYAQQKPVAAEEQPAKQPACLAAVVTGENYPDGTVFSPGAAFTKRWTLKNTGTCTWTTGYTLRFMSGNSLSGPASVNFPHSVPPGGSVELLVPMVAPANNGTFRGDWGLYSSSNVYMGKMWVSIRVTEGTTDPVADTGDFSVTGASVKVDEAGIVYTCVGGVGDADVPVSAKITTNDSGLVTYGWKFPGDPSVFLQNLLFSSARSITVSEVFTYSVTDVPADFSIRVYIDSPNSFLSDAKTFTLVCP